MSRVALVINPSSRQAARAVEAVTRACQVAGLEEPVVAETTVDDPGPEQTRAALAGGADRIIVAGGDGTVRLVAGQIATSTGGENSPARRPVLGVIPVGTANLFARSAGLPLRDLDAAAYRAVHGSARPTDLGWASLSGDDEDLEKGPGRAEPFLVVAGLGHDAATLAAVRSQAKSRVRWLAYFLPAISRLGKVGHALTLCVDGQPVSEVGPLWSLLAVNAARLPAGARVVPGARLDDGVLHAVLVAPQGLGDWLRIAATGLGPMRGTDLPDDHPALRYRAARQIMVRAPEPVLAQVDGDVIPAVRQALLRVEPMAVPVAR